MFSLEFFLLIICIKNKKRIDSLEFVLDDHEFIYKNKDIIFKFDAEHPAKHIKKSYKNIEILTLDDQLIIIPLDDFLLEYKDSKAIESHIESVNKLF